MGRGFKFGGFELNFLYAWLNCLAVIEPSNKQFNQRLVVGLYNKMKNIIEKYKKGELTNEIDEKYAGGFWDYAGDITSSYRNKIMEEKDIEELQGEIYYALTELHRKLK